MSNKQQPYFYSKILLFGEYSLMMGSNALSIPSDKYKGKLSFAKAESLQGEQIQSNHELKKFALALKNMQDNNITDVNINFGQLFNDLDTGLFFDSNIPQGYGLGSSGALVAAIYNEYGIDIKAREDNFNAEEISVLKNSFSKMESFFHGKSSGLDPLICFFNKPVLVSNGSSISMVDLPELQKNSNRVLFLLDTKLSGETQPLVNYFIKQSKIKSYSDNITNKLIPLNKQCINAFLKIDFSTLSMGMKLLSEFTLNNFSPMIPERIKPVWKWGLDKGVFSLKLCGSGGGGMMLGLTEDFEKTKSEINNYQLTPIYGF